MELRNGSIDIRRKIAFAELKPKCIAVSQLVLRADIQPQHSRQLTEVLQGLLTDLQRVLNDDRDVFNPAFGDYIFFPLSHIFGQQTKFTDRVLELSLSCLYTLISVCWQVNISGELAKQLMIMVTFIVGGTPQSSEPARVSEDTKLAGTLCLKSLFNAVHNSSSATIQLTLAETLPALGHCLTVVLEVLLGASLVDLQTAAITVVERLFVGCVNDDDILASFFPGTTSTLCKFLDSRHSKSKKSKSIVEGLETLSAVVCKVLGNLKVANLSTIDSKPASISDDQKTKALRTDAWLRATSEQVRMGLTTVCGLRNNRLLNVKAALLHLCEGIAQECSRSLRTSMNVMIETIVSLSADKDDGLATRSQSELRKLVSFDAHLAEILQSSLHGWILSLPRILQTNDEDRKAHLLRQIAVSFKLISEVGGNTDILLNLFSRTIKDSVLGLTRQDVPRIAFDNIMSDISPISMELIKRNTNTPSEYPRVLMMGNSQEETFSNTLNLLKMLGETSVGLQVAKEHVREARNGSETSRAVSVWMVLNILRSSENQVDEWLVESSNASKRKQLVIELYSIASLSVIETYDVPQASIELTCLSLEAVAYAAESLKEEFRGELVDVLYPIVHLFGSSVQVVQNHAIITLENIARSCGYSSTKDLLVENADYLVNAVSLKLNSFDIAPQAPIVLLMMIKLSGPLLVPFLDDLVISIFSALENFHGYESLTESLFSVLAGIVDESASATNEILLIKDENLVGSPEIKNRIKRQHMMTLDDTLNNLDLLVRKQSEPLFHNADLKSPEIFPKQPWKDVPGEPEVLPPDEDTMDDNEETDSQGGTLERKEPTPNHTYLMIESIARLSQNFLTSNSPSLRNHLLKLITTASPILARQEDSFLPLVHQLWPVIIERLQDPETYIIISALHAVARLCIDCGDFMSSRIEEAWPTIRQLAQSVNRKIVQGADMRETFGDRTSQNNQKNIVKSHRPHPATDAYAPHIQIWGAMVALFEAIAVYTRMTDTMFDEIVEMVAQGLVQGEHTSLRDALEDVDRDALWLEVKSRRKDTWLELPPENVQVYMDGELREWVFLPVVF